MKTASTVTVRGNRLLTYLATAGYTRQSVCWIFAGWRAPWDLS